jgi:sulfonate transport system substrate-binding protein
VPTDLPRSRGPNMRRIVQRVIAAIMLSIGIVAAAVGTTYG